MDKTLEELLTPEEQAALNEMADGIITEKSAKHIFGEKLTIIKRGKLKDLLKYDESGVATDTMKPTDNAVAVKLRSGEVAVYPADEIEESNENNMNENKFTDKILDTAEKLKKLAKNDKAANTWINAIIQFAEGTLDNKGMQKANAAASKAVDSKLFTKMVDLMGVELGRNMKGPLTDVLESKDEDDKEDVEESEGEDKEEVDESTDKDEAEVEESEEEEVDESTDEDEVEESEDEDEEVTENIKNLGDKKAKPFKKEEAEDDESEDEDEVKESEEEDEAEDEVKESEEDAEDEVEESEDDKMDDEDVAESLRVLISSDDSLSEDFKSTAAILFEAAVAQKVLSIKENYKTQLVEAKDQHFNTLAGKIDTFLTSVVEEWVSDNNEAITASVRTDIAESFITNLKTVFEDHYIEIPEGKVDLFDDMSEKASDLEEKFEASVTTIEIMSERMQVLEKEKILREATEGLVKTDAEKLKNLAESLDYDTFDAFTNKIKVVKENFILNDGLGERSNDLNEKTSESSGTVTKVTKLEEDEVRETNTVMGQVVSVLNKTNN